MANNTCKFIFRNFKKEEARTTKKVKMKLLKK